MGHAVHASQATTQMISYDAVRARAIAGAGAASAARVAQSAAETGADEAAAPAATVAQAAQAPATVSSTVEDAAKSGTGVSAQAVNSIEEPGGFFLPRPTYTMKASAPRREPAPLGDADVTTPANAAQRASADSAEDAAGALDAAGVQEPPTTTNGLGANLNDILARRRASGE